MAVENVLAQHIEKTPGVVGGKARIAGTRITVQNIVVWHERQAMSPDEIIAEFPQLTLADVYAALAYYFDNRQEFDESFAREKAFVEEMKMRYPSKLKEKLGQ
ncbi:MAG: hypothetical protein HDKAJFGB_00437 [Anaerolineae bacterium]|nr:hypothetical protein [Anaerolineae bacterium]